MGQRKNRAAQVWAVQLAEGITRALAEGRTLPFALPGFDPLEKGKALRYGQEVNYAKKQEEAKGAKRGYWTLKGILQEDGLYVMTVVTPSSRSREESQELHQRVGLALASFESNAPAQPIPTGQLAQATQALTEVDAQEEMIKKMYGM